MDEISFKELFVILKRGIRLMVVVPLIATLFTGMVNYLYLQDQYTAQTRLYVLIDYRDANGRERYDVYSSSSFVDDYQQLIMTYEVLSAAAERLGAENLDSLNIDVSAMEDTRVIRLDVTGTDPAFSMNAANTISEVFIEHLSTITQTKSATIASRAEKPNEPSGPNRPRNVALAFAMSNLSVAGALVVLAKLNTRLRTSDDVEDCLQLPVLARITSCKKELNRFMARKSGQTALFHLVSQDTREGIKTLAMNLAFLSGNDTAKTIMITSALPSEGKSTISVMLASALAEDGKRVLLIEMDFINPSLGKYLGIRSRLDLVDVLNRNANMDQIIVKTSLARVSLIDCYHKCVSLSNVVQSVRYKELVDSVSHYYDYVIFDTPPIGCINDTAILAKLADRTLLVVASGRVERALEKDVVDQLQKANASIIGVALNLTLDRYGRYGHYYRKFRNGDYSPNYQEVESMNCHTVARADELALSLRHPGREDDLYGEGENGATRRHGYIQ